MGSLTVKGHDYNWKSSTPNMLLITWVESSRCRLTWVGFDGALILHSLEESQVESLVAFIRERI